MPLAMGMRMRASALRSTSSGRPAPSLPTRRATGWHQSISQGARSGGSPSRGSWTLDASVRTPATLNCARRIESDIPARIGRCRAAPAEARRAFGEKGFAVPLMPEAAVAAPVAPNAAAVRRMVPTLPGSWTPAKTTSKGAQAETGARTRSSKDVSRGLTSAATPWGCSESARPSKRRSVVRRVGKAISGRSIKGARRSQWRSPDSPKSTARIGQPERKASSTRRTPSTPTNPPSVGRPPRKAMRNSFSQRLSRLVRSAALFAGRALRAIFPGVAITVEGSKVSVVQANPTELFQAANGVAPLRRPVRNVLRTRRILLLSYVFSSDVVTLLVVIWMGVAIIPVIRLLPLARLREFVRIPVLCRKVLPPGAIFVVVPVVIVLVLSIVDSELNAGLLRYRSGHNGHRRHKGSGQEQRSD